MEQTLAFKGKVNPLFGKTTEFPEKYRNHVLDNYADRHITARMVGCTAYPGIGAVITYVWEGKKIYDVLDFPGNPQDVNDERKKRYMTMFGTKNKTVKDALTHPLSFSSSIGAIWGNKVRRKGKSFDAVLHVHNGGWLELIDGQVV